MTRYDFATLARVMGMSEPEAVTALNIDAKSAILYRRDGMSELVADRVAVRAGFVPYAVWDGWLEDARRSCPECRVPFMPGRSDQRFCSRSCRNRGASRRYQAKRRADPEGAQADRDKSRRYYNESRPAIRVQQRLYKAAHADEIRAWREANKATENARRRELYAKNKDNIRHKKSEIVADKYIDYKGGDFYKHTVMDSRNDGASSPSEADSVAGTAPPLMDNGAMEKVA